MHQVMEIIKFLAVLAIVYGGYVGVEWMKNAPRRVRHNIRRRCVTAIWKRAEFQSAFGIRTSDIWELPVEDMCIHIADEEANTLSGLLAALFFGQTAETYCEWARNSLPIFKQDVVQELNRHSKM